MFCIFDSFYWIFHNIGWNGYKYGPRSAGPVCQSRSGSGKVMLIRPDPDPQHCTVQFSTLQYSTAQHSTSTAQYSTAQYSHSEVRLQHRTVQYSTVPTVQYICVLPGSGSGCYSPAWQYRASGRCSSCWRVPSGGCSGPCPASSCKQKKSSSQKNQVLRSASTVCDSGFRIRMGTGEGIRIIFPGFRFKHDFTVLWLPYGIFPCFGKIRSNSTKMIIHKKNFRKQCCGAIAKRRGA